MKKKLFDSLDPKVQRHLRSQIFPTLNLLCRRLPAEMLQVLERRFGNLDNWIEFNTGCGCLVGTTALVCGGIKPHRRKLKTLVEVPSEYHHMIPIDPFYGFATDRTGVDFLSHLLAKDTEDRETIHRRVREMGGQVPTIRQLIVQTEEFITRKEAHDKTVAVLKEHIRKQLKKPAALKKVRAWQRQHCNV